MNTLSKPSVLKQPLYRAYFIFIILAAGLLLSSCLFDSPKAQGGSETEGISGTLVLKDGTPASGAIVTLSEYAGDPLAKPLGKVGASGDSYTDTTNADGGYFFDSPAVAEFYLEGIFIDITTDDTLVTYIKGIVYEANESKDLGQDTLKAPGQVYGSVFYQNIGQEDADCYVPGTSYFARTNSSGICIIYNVSPGEYSARFRLSGFSPITIPAVTVQSGLQTVIPPVALELDPTGLPAEPGNFSAVYDRSTGIVNLSWDTVPVSDLDGYIIYRNPTSTTTPTELIPGQLIRSQVYSDTLFTDMADTASLHLIYRVKSQDIQANQSASFSQPDTILARAPLIPAIPSPSNGQSAVSVLPLLKWLAVAPPGNEPVLYTVLLGTQNPPQSAVSQGQSANYLALSNLNDGTTYYWRVVALIGAQAVQGPVWSFTTAAAPPENASPNTPGTPTPADKSVGQAIINIGLSWQGGDPDTADLLKYDIHLSKENPPVTKILSGLQNTSVTLPSLENNTTYYWQVKASDSKATASGPVWQFTTKAVTAGNQPPNLPAGPYPLDASQNQALEVTLSWQGGDPDSDNVTYNIYLETKNPPVQQVAAGLSQASFQISGLAPQSTYFWYIVSSDGNANVNGPIWSFTTQANNPLNTPPDLPSNPSPVTGSTGKDLNLTLTWVSGDADQDTLHYDVYLGTSNPPTTKTASNLSKNQLEIYGLTTSTSYYWYVAATDGQASINGPVWSFTTKQATSGNTPPTVPLLINPTAGDTGLELPINLTWSSSDPDAGDSLFYIVFLDKSSPPVSAYEVNIRDTSVAAADLEWGATYYWQVIASDGKSTTPSAVGSFSIKSLVKPNTAPNTPSEPAPANGAGNVDTNSILTWKGGDADAGDEVTYDIYISTSNPPVNKAASLPGQLYYQASGLVNNQTYYWRVVAHDGEAASLGPVWNFTTKAPANTPPAAPSLPSPAHSATGVDTNVTLTWSGSDADAGDQLKYSFYLDTHNPPGLIVGNNLSNHSYTVSNLSENTVYYWRVIASDGKAATLGPVWQFTTKTYPRMVAHWDFNEGSGAIVSDKSGNGHHGTIVGNPAWLNGVDGNALNFDGDGDYVSIPESDALDLTGSLTITAWVYTNVSNRYIYCSHDIGTTNHMGWGLAVGGGSPMLPANSGKNTFYNNSDGPWNWKPGSADILNLQWSHVAAVYNVSTSELKLYLNGVQDGPTYTGFGSASDNNTESRIGASITGLNGFYGIIDEMKIWNSALPASQIQSEWQTFTPPPRSNLVGYWDFNEGAGNTLQDKSVNSRDGLIYGATWAEGVSGKALSFDGINDYVDIPIASSDKITISYWTKIDTTWMTFVNFHRNYLGTMTSHDCLGAEAGLVYQVMPYNNMVSITKSWTSHHLSNHDGYGNILGSSGWNHIVYVVDKTQSTPGVDASHIYLNGQEITYTEGVNGGFLEDTRLYINRMTHEDGRVYYGKGLMDELVIYNTLLSASSIDSLYISYLPVPPTPLGTLIAHWDFNENTGNILNDKTGNGHNGTITGATWSSGINGSALYFDGTGDWVSIPESDQMDFTGSFTISTWVKTTDNDKYIYCSHSLLADGHIGWGVGVGTGTPYGAGPGKFNFWSGGSASWLTGPASINTGGWVQATAVYSHPDKTLILYTNGIQQEVTITGVEPPQNNNSESRIGASITGLNSIIGYIDEIKIYDYALSPQEVDSLFTAF